MSEKTIDLARTNGKFKRVRPFHGMLLGAEDFQDEQTYFRKKIKLQNQLRGYGVVCGLQLLAHPDDPDKNPKKSKIIVTPGMALDCNGNEIVVCEEQVVDLADAIDDLFQVTQTRILHIGIKYSERNTEPEAVYTADCGCEEKRCDFSRVQEGFLIKVFRMDALPWQPQFDFGKFGDPCSYDFWQPFCPRDEEKEHYVLLGWIDFSDGTRIVTDQKIKNHRKYLPADPPAVVGSIMESQLIPRTVIDAICAEQPKWVNITFVIGMEAGAATTKLIQEYQFPTNKVKSKKLDKSALRLVFGRAANFLPFATTSDEVHLYYYDDSKKTVLFPLIEPS